MTASAHLQWFVGRDHLGVSLFAVTLLGLSSLGAVAQLSEMPATPESEHRDPMSEPSDKAQPSRNDAVTRAVDDSGIALEIDGRDWITLTVTGATRRLVLERLFAERAIEIEWRNKAFAQQAVHGRFSGPADTVARRLLARSDYVIVYTATDGESRMSRITILGSDPVSVSPAIKAPAGTWALRSPPISSRSPAVSQTLQTLQAQLAAKAEHRRQAAEVVRRRQAVPGSNGRF
jgi:hypothetical protein